MSNNDFLEGYTNQIIKEIKAGRCGFQFDRLSPRLEDEKLLLSYLNDDGRGTFYQLSKPIDTQRGLITLYEDMQYKMSGGNNVSFKEVDVQSTMTTITTVTPPFDIRSIHCPYGYEMTLAFDSNAADMVITGPVTIDCFAIISRTSSPRIVRDRNSPSHYDDGFMFMGIDYWESRSMVLRGRVEPITINQSFAPDPKRDGKIKTISIRNVFPVNPATYRELRESDTQTTVAHMFCVEEEPILKELMIRTRPDTFLPSLFVNPLTEEDVYGYKNTNVIGEIIHPLMLSYRHHFTESPSQDYIDFCNLYRTHLTAPGDVTQATEEFRYQLSLIPLDNKPLSDPTDPLPDPTDPPGPGFATQIDQNRQNTALIASSIAAGVLVIVGGIWFMVQRNRNNDKSTMV